MAETEQERESWIIAEFHQIMARRGGQARAQALTEERRREIASKAGKAAAENMSSDERTERARRAARLRWAARRGFFAYMNEL
jgi:general stress protein YciG